MFGCRFINMLEMQCEVISNPNRCVPIYLNNSHLKWLNSPQFVLAVLFYGPNQKFHRSIAIVEPTEMLG